MQILKTDLYRFPMTEEIEHFLDTILAKINAERQNDSLSSIKLDELYGILPCTTAERHGRKTENKHFQDCIEKWNLSEILILKNDWDKMTAEIWKQDGKYFCLGLELYGKKWESSISTESEIAASAGKIYPFAVRRLALLSSAFGNTPLRQLGIRRYVHDLLVPLADQERYFYLELFLTLFNLELSENELQNQDLFLKRAKIHFQSIVGQRAKCGVLPEFSRVAEIAAVRGSDRLFSAIYAPINMIWGFLANRKIMKPQGMEPQGKFCFYEYYDARGNVSLGEIFPVGEKDKSTLKIMHDRDCYMQVFPNYQTALLFRNTANQMLEKWRHK